MDSSEKNIQLMETPELDADYAAAYYDNLQKGAVAVRARFFQTSEDYTVEFEEWAAIIADSLGG